MTTAADPLIHVRELTPFGGDRHQLAREARRGSIHRVRRGTYVAAGVWQALSATEQYVAVCRAAAAAARTPFVLSHWSAAALHGIPLIGPWPPQVHRLIERRSGGRSGPGVYAHPARLDAADVVDIDGLTVTSVARTIVDLAAAATPACAVTAADWSLHRKRPGHIALSDLSAALDAAKPVKAGRRVERVIDFATHLSDSPAESVSRVHMFQAGLVPPELQCEFFDGDGRIGATDFFWEKVSLIGEVDGRQKYVKAEYLRGRSPGEVVYEEKLREDRLRAVGHNVIRWDWFRAADLRALSDFLVAAGVPRRAARN